MKIRLGVLYHLEDAVDDAIRQGVVAVSDEVLLADHKVVVLVQFPELHASTQISPSVNAAPAHGEQVSTGIPPPANCSGAWEQMGAEMPHILAAFTRSSNITVKGL